MGWERDTFAGAHLGSWVMLKSNILIHAIPKGLFNPYVFLEHTTRPYRISRIQNLGLNVNIGIEGVTMEALFSSRHFNLLNY
jgi:hypothetical protein